MRNRKIILLVIIATIAMLLAFSACQAQPATEPTAVLSSTVTITQTPTERPTRTPKPTKTATSTPSATLDARDFDVSTIKTVTPAIPQQCPFADASIEIDTNALVKYVTFEIKDMEPVPVGIDMDLFLDYLNRGVGAEIMIEKIESDEILRGFLSKFQFVDLTGDGITDIILNMNNVINIITCSENQYQTIEIGGDFTVNNTYFFDILDVNNDGLQDIAAEYTFAGTGVDYNFNLYTWNGDEFIQINDTPCIRTEGLFSVDFNDIDNNGIKDIVIFHNARKPSIYRETLFPDRDFTKICMWNGSQYVLTEQYCGEPVYRVQAYLDAVSQSEQRDYDKALELYLRVIHDENLQWFMAGKEEYSRRYWSVIMEFMAEDFPNIINDPMYTYDVRKDIYEYPLLASASYYRMLLIYLDQGDIKNAETMLIILEDAYPPGAIGGYFTEMGEIVIENYKETNDLTQACPEVLTFAEENYSELYSILTYLKMTDFYLGRTSWCPYLPEEYGEE